MLDLLDAATAVRWSRVALEALGAAREEIDALNVFPVPDGDTGTNLYLTMEAAAHAAQPDGHDLSGDAAGEAAEPATAHKALVAVLAAMAEGAFNGARGNSGVILSQLLGAFADALATLPRADGPALAAALSHAADAGYAAVARPVEGTMLTVAKAAAQAATACVAGAAASLSAVAEAAAAGARTALAETPLRLDVLAQAGVVDAGGRGLCVLLDVLADTVAGVSRPRPTRPHLPLLAATAMPPVSARQADSSDAALAAEAERPTGARAAAAAEEAATRLVGVAGGCSAAPGASADPACEGAFEVMYLLDAPPEAVAVLRDRLQAVGGSLVVVGGPQQWNVHVHTDDAGAAVEAGIAAGHPHQVRITHLASLARPAAPAGGRAVLVLATADGLTGVFTAGGAAVVPCAGTQPSSAAILDELRRCGAAEVAIIACDVRQHVAATVAAEQAQLVGIRAGVVPAKAPVQAIAALAVHEPGRRFDADVVTMTAAAGATRVGALAVAESQAWTTVGVCEAGDALGLIDGDVAVIGPDLEDVAVTVVERMLAGGGELVTLLTGDGAPAAAGAPVADGLVNRVSMHLRAFRPEVDVTVYAGGVADCPLMIGVE